VTTRSPRKKEQDGIDYYFVSNEQFDSLIKNKKLAEWATVFGDRYGTPLSEIKKAIAANNVLLCDIDVQGGMSLKQKFDEAVAIFLVPPSMAELRRRLFGRKTDTAEQRKIRLQTAIWELSSWNKYDYIVLNDDLKKATDEVDMIIAAERAKTKRRNNRRFWRPPQARLLGL
jgi:guanylate kinase